METTLHRQLKEHYGQLRGGRLEVSLADSGTRIDAVAADGELIEIQASALGALRDKLRRLLDRGHRVRVVKPWVTRRRIVRRDRPDGPDRSARLSPRRGEAIDCFDELIRLLRVFPHPGLTIELLAVEIDEVRVAQRRRPGYVVVDRRLRATAAEPRILRVADDLWGLIPEGLPPTFTTLDLAERLGRSVWFAQRVAYCLRTTGAARAVSKVGNRVEYRRMEFTASL